MAAGGAGTGCWDAEMESLAEESALWRPPRALQARRLPGQGGDRCMKEPAGPGRRGTARRGKVLLGNGAVLPENCAILAVTGTVLVDTVKYCQGTVQYCQARYSRGTGQYCRGMVQYWQGKARY
ncbi:hypothetical protein NDU88_011373 [Pleurodeles waltl]|uniref:Uncharacterized protein n=1 Tax=Pleurodeles waltl TaxID=8319 RepID=A0AAV7Q0N0_PLEWA|nr:hypothetical protein NDU88_011373 [Pleurodeles waltl]